MKRVPMFLTICMLFLASSGWISIVMAQAIKPLSGTKGAAAINNGVNHFNQGQLTSAQTHFQTALKSNPRSAVAHYNLALTYNRLGKSDKATKHFQEAAKLGRMNSFIQNSRILKQHVPSASGK